VGDEVIRTRAADHDGRSRPARDAATVLIVRDAADGLEVLLQERHVETDFVGGALVFPGGAVDEGDGMLDPGLWTGADPAAVGTALGADASGGLALLVAAAREVFEEAGLLLAVDADGVPVPAELLTVEDVARTRGELAARDAGGDLPGLLRRHGLRLDLGDLVPWAWWVTPEGMHRRYDTRFFVTPVPGAQRGSATSDAVETTSARWLRPADALAAGLDGRHTIIFPTRRVLADLSRHDTVAAAMAAARAGVPSIARLQPRVLREAGRVLVTLDDGSPPEEP
jgi:8-oxo-dGTP pyrophosphatase MutT (NUDIX family)